MCFYKNRSLAQGICFLQYSLSHFLIAFRLKNCYTYIAFIKESSLTLALIRRFSVFREIAELIRIVVEPEP